MTANRRRVALLLNIGHALDHMFLLIFATAVTAMAVEFGRDSWEDLMKFSVGAALMFGLGSIPSGRLGDLWGRRRMMVVFFIGIGLSSLLVALTRNVWQLAAALTLLGAFASIYHPVGIPMLMQKATRPGLTIGINGLSGNLGIAVAALATGFFVKYLGWRSAFVIPGLISIACGLLFVMWCPPETESPSKRTAKASVSLPPALMARVFLIMTATAITGSLLFSLTTNGNAHLMRERFSGIIEDPATLGMLLAAVYAIGSFSQVIVGRMIDRYAFRRLYLGIVAMQIPFFLLASTASGWALFVAQIGFMAMIFGAIPFTDAMIYRYVDDAMRSRVSGMRLAVAFSGSSLAIWFLGPAVKAAGFPALLVAMAIVAALTAAAVAMLPAEPQQAKPQPAPA